MVATSEIARVLPQWPGRGEAGVRRRARMGGVFGSLSARHAERVWEEARWEGYREWLKGGRPVSGEQGTLLALDLVFLGALAAHVIGCERCPRPCRADGSEALGVVDDTPSEWLRWAVWAVPRFRDVAEAVGLPRRWGGRPPWPTVMARTAGGAWPLPDSVPVVGEPEESVLAGIAALAANVADRDAAAEAARVRRRAARIRKDRRATG